MDFLESLPLIPSSIFFTIMFLLQAFDAFSTAKGLRNNAIETNGFLRRLIKLFGINQALTLMKVTYLVFLWFNPSVEPWAQWLSILVFSLLAINNFKVLKKMDII